MKYWLLLSVPTYRNISFLFKCQLTTSLAMTRIKQKKFCLLPIVSLVILLFYTTYLYRRAFGKQETIGREGKGLIFVHPEWSTLLFKPLKPSELAESLLAHKGSIISEETKTLWKVIWSLWHERGTRKKSESSAFRTPGGCFIHWATRTHGELDHINGAANVPRLCLFTFYISLI